MQRKKILFVIVEGPSDSEALGLILSRLFAQNEVYIHVAFGDITSDKDTNPQNILRKIADMVQDFQNRNHLKTSDFLRIVHLIDTDGVFVPECAVIEDKNCHTLIYSEMEIHGPDRHAIIRRNQLKSANIRRVYSCGKVCKSIPYQAFYMSCNLDHVLHNLQNASDEEKEKSAFSFAKRYRDDIPGFKRFISESDFSVTGDYLKSWEYIQQDLHSLERHTNLGIWFQPQ